MERVYLHVSGSPTPFFFFEKYFIALQRGISMSADFLLTYDASVMLSADVYFLSFFSLTSVGNVYLYVSLLYIMDFGWSFFDNENGSQLYTVIFLRQIQMRREFKKKNTDCGFFNVSSLGTENLKGTFCTLLWFYYFSFSFSDFT